MYSQKVRHIFYSAEHGNTEYYDILLNGIIIYYAHPVAYIQFFKGRGMDEIILI